MRQLLSTSALLATIVACTAPMPPPPVVTVTSPERGMIQSDAAQVVVKGTTRPAADGSPVTSVTVNKVPATLAADGSFTATIDVPAGASLLETVAFSQEGGFATDARAVQIGPRRAVGSNIERAVSAAISTEAFAKLATAAGPYIKQTDFNQLLAPLQPMASLGDSWVNLKLSITKFALSDAKVTLTPVDGGLQFSAEIDALDVDAKAAYGGTLVIDGTTTANVKTDKVTISGTLIVTPSGTAGFTTKIDAPTVHTTTLHLQASGLVGDAYNLLHDHLDATIQDFVTRSAEKALQPLINNALGALAGPKSFDVLGKKLDLQASPSAITFSHAGAIVTMNLEAKLAGSESSPGYIFTPNGTPTLTLSPNGIQAALADDLVNELLAEVHALGLLNIHLAKDYGLFDTADIKLAMPPMISANNGDGSLRLLLGDMIATFSDKGQPVISAAINAQVDLQILRGTKAQEIALQFGKVHLFVNVLGDPNAEGPGGEDLSGAATAGIGVQLDSLSQFLINVPVPSVAGVSLDNLALHADSGYLVVSGEVH